jgi:glycosyltransferase involved in cell wall biosynthesis
MAGLSSEIRQHISFLGVRKDMASLYAAADVFLLCSDNEGMPNVIMESMLMGLPVVCTNVGAIPDLVQDNVTGFIHAVGDIDGMAHDVVRLLKDHDLRQAFADAGREHIAEFSMEKLADRAVAAYMKQLNIQA